MNCRLPVLLILTAVALFAGCSGKETGPRDRFGESGPIAAEDSNPLQNALQILGLQESDLRRPVVNEEDYRALARLPLVDQLSQSPFFLQQWAENTSRRLQLAAEIGIAGVFPASAQILNGGVRYPAHHGRIPAEPRLSEALRYLYGRYRLPPNATIFDQIEKAGISLALEQELARLVSVLADAAVLLDGAYANLSTDEAAYLAHRPERYFYPDGSTFNFLTAPTHVQTKILAIAQKIDFTAVLTAAAWISAAIDDFIGNLPHDRESNRSFQSHGPAGGMLLDIPTPLGSIIIAGAGDDRHNKTGALIVDLGGNDSYRFQTGASAPASGRLSVLIDLAGNDVYGERGDRAVQGFGSLSIDMLVDRQGNDRYRAGDLAQGCGMFGVGVLADYEGSDVYEMGLIGQGFGLFGIGVLLDRRGNDRYTVTGLGQGAGSTMGMGVLCDAGGSDKYLADRQRAYGQLAADDWSHVQGVGLSVRSPDWGRQASLYGGIGFLSDGRGDDFYYSSHENCMGASYFLSIGALVDHDGNDRYIPGKGLGIGWAIHLGSAAFVDHRGDDRYYGSLLSGGAASDRSIAIMVDYEGNDSYGPTEAYARAQVEQAAQKQPLTEADTRTGIRARLAQNAYASARKPKAFGMLIDYRGNDRYTANPDEFGQSFGGLIPPIDPQDWSHAILLDLGGHDTYSHPDRKNNHYFKWMGHALCYDTESVVSAVGGNWVPVKHAAAQPPEADIARSEESVLNQDVSRLRNPDVFYRFAARGEMVAKNEPAAIDELLHFLTTSPEDALNAEMLEVVDALLFAGKMPGGRKDALIALLAASDPRVRVFSAGKLGRWQIRSALPALIQKGTDPEEAFRIQVIRAIGRISAGDAIDFLLEAGSSDPSAACRREAFLALSSWAAGAGSAQPRVAERISVDMLKALEHKDEVIRTAAAATLVCCASRESVREALKRRLLDESFYVRRAAAKSLIFNGFTSGIAALIETLQFPSIDTQQHYDRELAIELAFFCGVDFSEEHRYQYKTWKKWWDENKETVDLQRNLAVRHQIKRALAEKSETDGIAIFEDLRRQYPHNVVIVNRYVQFCSEWITLRLLTRKNVDRQVLERCLRLQKILTQLQPGEAERWVSLAYFQYRLGNAQLALAGMETALQIDPDNPTYRQKRDAYRLLIKEKGAQPAPEAS